MSKTIVIHCPKCDKRKEVRREPDDPLLAARVDIQCPKCNGGDFDSPVYFDVEGSEVPFAATE